MRIAGICFTRSGMELARRMHEWFESENEANAAEASEKDGTASNESAGTTAGTTASSYEDTWFCKGKVFRDAVPEGFTFAEEHCSDWAGKYFSDSDALVFIGATGICVRAIAPYVKDKKTDPAVICFDEKGTFGISLLSGHIGGANALTEKLCRVLGSIPVVTTATDVNKKFAVDVYATEQNLAISSMLLAKDVSAAIVSGKNVPFSSDTAIERLGKLPGGLKLYIGDGGEYSFSKDNGKMNTGDGGEYSFPLGIHVSPFYKSKPYENTLYLIPRCMTIGIGCRRDTPVEKIEDLVDKTLAEYQIHPQALKAVATIDLKKDEKGLLEFCRRRNLPFTVYTADELKAVEGDFTPSAFVSGITGVDNVCERSAVLHGGGTLIIRKTKGDGVTCAVTLENWRTKI